jgi:hypothetical protein
MRRSRRPRADHEIHARLRRLERGGVLVDREQTVPLEAEWLGRLSGDLFPEIDADPTQLHQCGGAALEPALAGRQQELDQPAQEGGIETRLDIERTLGVEHPFERLEQHRGIGKRHGLRRREPPRVAVRAAMAHAIALQDDYVCATPGQFHRAGHTNDSAADDCDVVFHRIQAIHITRRPDGGRRGRQDPDYGLAIDWRWLRLAVSSVPAWRSSARHGSPAVPAARRRPTR